MSLRPEICAVGLGFCKLVCSGVIRQEWSLRRTGPHGQTGVQKQMGEAGGEVGDKVIRDGAQSLLYFSRQLSIMVFLLKEAPKMSLYSSRKQFLKRECFRIHSYLVSHCAKQVSY